MSGDEWTPDEVEQLLAAVQELIALYDKATVAEMARRFDEEQVIPEGHCVLFGLEGQVDRVWMVPEPLPEVLKAPIPPALWRAAPDPMYPEMRTAEYRRIAGSTYQRTR